MRDCDDNPRVVQFGEFFLDLSRMVLLRGIERLHLTSKPLEVLVYLVGNSGRTASKRELMEAVWKDTFVTEDNLSQAILKIRRALGDEKEDPRFILTVPRVGYRFIGNAKQLLVQPPEPGIGTIPRRARWRIRGAAWVTAAGLFAIFLAAAGFWLAGHVAEVGRSETPPAMPAAPAPLEVLLPNPSATKPVIAPDGLRFLFVGYTRERPGIGDLYLASATGSSVTRITEGMDPRGDHPVFSTDGSEVVFTRWRGGDDGTRWPDLWVVPASGGAGRLLIEQASGAGFSSDGQWIGYTKHLPGGRPLWVSPRSDPSRHREIVPVGFMPRWSPDNRWIAYTTSNPEGGDGELWIASADLVARRQLTMNPEQFYGMAWTPDSRSLVFAANRAGAFSLCRISIDGAPRTVLAGGIGSYLSPSVSPDGRTLLFSHVLSSRSLYYSARIDHDPDVELTRGQYHLWPALSPDGRWISSVIRTPGFGDRLYRTAIDNGQPLRIGDRSATHPAWIDCEHLAYIHGDGSGGSEVRVVEVPGGADRAICRFQEPASWLAIQPDGQRIAVVLAAPNGRQRIAVRDPGTGQVLTLAEGQEYEHLRWVPGGNLLSWSGPIKSAGPQSDGIWIAESGGLGPKQLIPDGHNPVWGDNGSMVYYSRIGDHSGLWRYDLRRAKSVRIRSWTEVNSFDLRGESLVFARVASDTHIFRLPLR